MQQFPAQPDQYDVVFLDESTREQFTAKVRDEEARLLLDGEPVALKVRIRGIPRILPFYYVEGVRRLSPR